MNNVVFHIGLYKCGSTFLQSKVFSRIPGINYVCSNRFEDYIVDSSKINLFSAEYLSYCVPHYYDVDRQFNILFMIKKLFPDARVIVVYRSYDSWFKSCYNQYVKGYGRCMSYKRYKELYYNSFDMNYYLEYVDFLFNDVLFIDLKDLNDSIIDVFNFVGVFPFDVDDVVVNKSVSVLQLQFIRFLNFFKLHFLFKFFYRCVNGF